MTPLEFSIVAPVVFLAVLALVLLMVGAFTGSGRGTGALAALGLGLAVVLGFVTPALGAVGMVAEGSPLLYATPFTAVAALLVAGLGVLCVPLMVDFFRGKACKPELFVLLVLSVLGMNVMMASSHLLTLYMGLEVMSFPLYILAAFVRHEAKSSEAGLKYFVLGGLASVFVLFGVALLYAATGKMGFVGLHAVFAAGGAPVLATVGAVMVLAGVLFKLSVVPFHMWTPDVYEGSPTPVTALMASLPKIAAFVLLVRLVSGPFAGLHAVWQPMLAVLAVAGMGAGAAVAVVQTNVKRLLAWSTIANVGFMLAGVVAGSPAGAAGVVFYVTVYALTSLGLFAGILLAHAETVGHLKGLHARAPWVAAGLMVLLFSLAGVPPLAGFMAKFAVFMAAVEAGYAWLAVVGVLASVIACYYSLMLIKGMYFEAPTTAVPLPGRLGYQIVLLVAVLVNIVLGIFPSVLTTTLGAVSGAVF